MDRGLNRLLRSLRTPRPKDDSPRLTLEEVNIREALSMLGDEYVSDYLSGKLSRDEALRITSARRRELSQRGL